jgi:acyl-CoA synthetase (AMP-forming)/AMP-acid ligase II
MIREILEKAALLGDVSFLRFRTNPSPSEMDERSNRAANLLREIGVRRGDKVCLMIGNRPEFVELWFGLAKLGAIMVPMEISLGQNSASYIASHPTRRSRGGRFRVSCDRGAAQEIAEDPEKDLVGSIGGAPRDS